MTSAATSWRSCSRPRAPRSSTSTWPPARCAGRGRWPRSPARRADAPPPTAGGLPRARAPRGPRRRERGRRRHGARRRRAPSATCASCGPTAAAHWYDARWRLVVDEPGGPTIVGIARLIDAERAALERMRFLADVSAALDASLDMERTLAAVADLCVRDLADWCSIDMAGDDRELRNVAVAHVDPAKVELAHRMRERYPPDPTRDRGRPRGPHRRAAALRRRERRAARRGRARRRAPRARALARPHVGADRAAARPRARPRRDHAGAHRRARGLHRGRRRLRRGGRGPRRAGGRQRAPVRRGARPGARLRRGARAARRARHGGAHRPGLPRHRLPLRARQRRAGRDQRRAGDRPPGPHRARGAAGDGHRDRGRARAGAGDGRGDRRPAARRRDAARARPRPPLRRQLLPGRAPARRAPGHRRHRRRRHRSRRGGAGPARAARPLRGAHARAERARPGLRAARRRARWSTSTRRPRP